MGARSNIVQARTSVFEPYDLEYFLKKHPVARKDAIRILQLHRNDRDACDRAAFNLKWNA
jgi:hypothetical protein